MEYSHLGFVVPKYSSPIEAEEYCLIVAEQWTVFHFHLYFHFYFH